MMTRSMRYWLKCRPSSKYNTNVLPACSYAVWTGGQTTNDEHMDSFYGRLGADIPSDYGGYGVSGDDDTDDSAHSNLYIQMSMVLEVSVWIGLRSSHTRNMEQAIQTVLYMWSML